MRARQNGRDRSFRAWVPGALHRQVGGTPSRASHAVGRSAALLKVRASRVPGFRSPSRDSSESSSCSSSSSSLRVEKRPRLLSHQRHPRHFLLLKGILRWRELFRVVETAGGDIDLPGPIIAFIGQRSAATVTEGPPCVCLGAESFRGTLLNLEPRQRHRKPSDRLRAHCSTAIAAVAVDLVHRWRRRGEPHGAAITSPSYLASSLVRHEVSRNERVPGCGC